MTQGSKSHQCRSCVSMFEMSQDKHMQSLRAPLRACRALRPMRGINQGELGLWTSNRTFSWSPSNKARKLACVPVVPFTPLKPRSSLALWMLRRSHKSSYEQTWSSIYCRTKHLSISRPESTMLLACQQLSTGQAESAWNLKSGDLCIVLRTSRAYRWQRPISIERVLRPHAGKLNPHCWKWRWNERRRNDFCQFDPIKDETVDIAAHSVT